MINKEADGGALLLGALLGAGGLGLIGKKIMSSPRSGRNIGKLIENTRFGRELTKNLPSVARGKVLESKMALMNLTQSAPWLAAASSIPLLMYMKSKPHHYIVPGGNAPLTALGEKGEYPMSEKKNTQVLTVPA